MNTNSYFAAKQKPSCYHHFDGFFDRTVPSKIPFTFPWNPYLKTDGTSFLILFFVKDFVEEEIHIIFEGTVPWKKSVKLMVITGLKSDAQRKAYQQHQSPTPKKLAIAQSLSGSFSCIFNTFSAIWKSCPCFITLHCKNVQVHATFLVLVFFY